MQCNEDDDLMVSKFLLSTVVEERSLDSKLDY